MSGGRVEASPSSPTDAEVLIADSGAQLARHLKVPGATALAITIVVGSGALVLPGIAFAKTGESAIYSWLIAAALTAPLLVVFAKLGSRFPGAGGIAGFVQAAAGRRAAAGTEVLLLGTFGLGIPAIALSGGGYLRAIAPLRPVPPAALAAGLVVAAVVVVVIGVQLSTRLQIFLAITLTAALFAIGIAGIATSEVVSFPSPTGSELRSAFVGLGVVFFAFTGWEMISFTTEEYAEPKRDFPRVVALSFVIVVIMYALLALATQSALVRSDESTTTSPVERIVYGIAPPLAPVVAVLGAIIILANLIGAVWGASRLVMSSSREGLLPRPLARVRSGVPRAAVLAVGACFLVVVALAGAEVISIDELLDIAGKNFFVLYLLCAAAYVILARTALAKSLGAVVTLGLAITVVTTFGWKQIVYAVSLFAVGCALSAFAGTRETDPATNSSR